MAFLFYLFASKQKKMCENENWQQKKMDYFKIKFTHTTHFLFNHLSSCYFEPSSVLSIGVQIVFLFMQRFF